MSKIFVLECKKYNGSKSKWVPLRYVKRSRVDGCHLISEVIPCSFKEKNVAEEAFDELLKTNAGEPFRLAEYERTAIILTPKTAAKVKNEVQNATAGGAQGTNRGQKAKIKKSETCK